MRDAQTGLCRLLFRLPGAAMPPTLMVIESALYQAGHEMGL